MDISSEEIAHFIGLFAMAEEEGRARASYESFWQTGRKGDNETDLPLHQVTIEDSFVLTPFRPNIDYSPPEFVLRLAWSGPGPEAGPLLVPLPDVWQNFGGIFLDPDAPILPLFSRMASSSVQVQYREAPAVDQIAAVIVQNATLYDVDVVEFREGMFGNIVISVNMEGLAKALAAAEAMQPFDMQFEAPQSEAAIAVMIEELAQMMQAIEEAGPSPAVSASGENAIGVFVDGEKVDARPELGERLATRNPEEPPKAAAEPSTVAVGQQVAGEGAIGTVSTFDMESGGNTLTNEVLLYDAMLSAPTMFVKGNYVSLDIIVQTTVLSDQDMISGTFVDGTVESEAINVAERLFFSNNPLAGLDASSFALPANFTLSTLEGNFLNLQWIEQTSRLVDDDWIGVTRTGAATYLQTGDNALANSVRSIELGTAYDLIVVLGNVWTANVIHQTNILVDDDTITRLPSQHPDAVNITHGDNLVWNEASIKHLGTPALQAMTSQGSALLDALGTGPGAVTPDMLQNPVFAGLGTLDILLVKGDYLDLDYIKQSIVATDSDHVLIDEADGPLGENSFDTGGNTAINVASIIDAGLDQHVEVAGSIYSDALIHQAGFLGDLGSFETDGASANDLASEAVLFLADDMLAGSTTEADHIDSMPVFQSTDDVLQTMLA